MGCQQEALTEELKIRNLNVLQTETDQLITYQLFFFILFSFLKKRRTKEKNMEYFIHRPKKYIQKILVNTPSGSPGDIIST